MLAHVQQLRNHLIPSLYSLFLSVPILIFLRYYIVNRHMAYWRLSAIISLLGLFFYLHEVLYQTKLAIVYFV